MNLKATDSDHISTQYNSGSQLWTKWFSSQETFSVVTTGGADASGIYWTEASNSAKYPAGIQQFTLQLNKLSSPKRL